METESCWDPTACLFVVLLGRQIMKQKHDELKAAIEKGIVDNSKAVGKNDDSYVLFEDCTSIFCLEEQ